MDQCRRNCWIAGGLAGLAVLIASSVLGSESWLAGLLMGLVTAGLLGGLLVWGLCEGRGSAAENEALAATYWEPEPFTPSRRIVAAGGRVVSQAPLGGDAPAGLEDSAALNRVTLQASRDPALSTLVTSPAPASEPPTSAEALEPPPVNLALLATPSVAAVIPVEPITLPQVTSQARPADEAASAALPEANGRQGSVTDLLPDDDAADPDAIHDDDPAELLPGGFLPGEGQPDRGAGPEAADVATDAPALDLTPTDELLQIDGVGPIQARWLRDSGVTSLRQIADWDGSDIARFAGMMGRDGHLIRSQDWAGQAARLTGRAG